jgi:hypothetical protein
MTGQGQRKTQAGSAAANYQNIVLKLLAHFRIPLKATRVGVALDIWTGEVRQPHSPLVYRGGERHNSRAHMAL